MARTLVLLALIFSPTVLFCASIGTLTSLEGQVTVLRAGLAIPSEKVTEGFFVEPFDTIATGPAGRADFRFLPALGLSGTLHFDPETSVYLDATVQKKEQVFGVEFLTGAVGVRLTSVSGTSEVAVRTSLGVVSGTGPQFRVVEAPSGDILVTSSSGKVKCQTANGSVFAYPGTIVELQSLGSGVVVRKVNAAVLDSYRETWFQERIKGLRGQTAAYFHSAGILYQIQAGHFQRAWDRVQLEPKPSGQTYQAAVVNLRRAAYPLERSLFQIRFLGQLLDDGTLPPTLELTRGYMARDFFQQTTKDDPGLSDRLGAARTLYKVLAETNGGDFPKAAEGVPVTWDSPFFR